MIIIITITRNFPNIYLWRCTQSEAVRCEIKSAYSMICVKLSLENHEVLQVSKNGTWGNSKLNRTARRLYRETYWPITVHAETVKKHRPLLSLSKEPIDQAALFSSPAEWAGSLKSSSALWLVRKFLVVPQMANLKDQAILYFNQ